MDNFIKQYGAIFGSVNIIPTIFLLGVLLYQCASTTETKKENPPVPAANVTPPPPKKDPLFHLNEKNTLFAEKCSCSVKRTKSQFADAGIMGGFLSRMEDKTTPESDREYDLHCKAKVTNKTAYKLQNLQLQWEYLSGTKFPMNKSKVVEYMNNYILPKSTAKVEIFLGTETGIKNYFTKEVKYFDCKVISAVDVSSGELLDE